MFELFNRYWWLLFPIAFFVYGAFQSWLSYRSNRETLELIKTYAAAGRDPPPELLNRLSKRQNFDADDHGERHRPRSNYDGWYQVVPRARPRAASRWRSSPSTARPRRCCR